MKDITLGDAAEVIPGSGITLTDAATGADHTQAVIAGATYAFTCGPLASSTFTLGIAEILTAANILWVCPPSETIIIRIPDGQATLHYQSLANGGTGYLRRLVLP